MQRTSDHSRQDDPISWSGATPPFTCHAVVPGLFQGDFPAGAIARVRSARGPFALSNPGFVAWLHEEAEADVPESRAATGRPHCPSRPRSRTER